MADQWAEYEPDYDEEGRKERAKEVLERIEARHGEA
eukprot:gene17436-10686_t